MRSWNATLRYNRVNWLPTSIIIDRGCGEQVLISQNDIISSKCFKMKMKRLTLFREQILLLYKPCWNKYFQLTCILYTNLSYFCNSSTDCLENRMQQWNVSRTDKADIARCMISCLLPWLLLTIALYPAWCAAWNAIRVLSGSDGAACRDRLVVW